MSNQFSKPQVTIDLDEYLSLKEAAKRDQPLLVGQVVSIEGAHVTGLHGIIVQLYREDGKDSVYTIKTNNGFLTLAVSRKI